MIQGTRKNGMKRSVRIVIMASMARPLRRCEHKSGMWLGRDIQRKHCE